MLVDNPVKILSETQVFPNQPVHTHSMILLLLLDALLFRRAISLLRDSMMSMTSTALFEAWHHSFPDLELHSVLGTMI